MMKVISVISCFICFIIGVGLLLTIFHQYSYGPYKKVKVKITEVEYSCKSAGPNQLSDTTYFIRGIYQGKIFETYSPYIGYRTISACFFGKVFSLHDIKNIRVGDEVKALLDNKGRIYLGKISYLNYVASMTLFFVLAVLFKKKTNS